MSSHESSPGDADTAQTLSRNRVWSWAPGSPARSFPATDMAARTLFSEALKDLPRDDINVVNLGRDDSDAEMTRRRYRSVFGDIPDERFHFDGALEWLRHLTS